MQIHVRLYMREAVALAVEEELQDQRRALVAARGLQRLPSSAIEMIGTLSGLQLQRAEGINEHLVQRDEAEESSEQINCCSLWREAAPSVCHLLTAT